MYYEVIQLVEGLSNVTLTAYIPDFIKDGQGLRPAVIICPGGAYLGITQKEAEPVALKFISEGYSAFVLNYSIGEMARFPSPMTDVARAVKLVRLNAFGWGIHQDKICICGFSTGGHAAAAFASSWQEDDLANILNSENDIWKPNALLLGYPLLNLNRFLNKHQESSQEMITLLEIMFTSVLGSANPPDSLLEEWNITNRITSSMPPTFLWATGGDSYVPVEDSLDFAGKLAAKQIPFEFHIFERGAHGLSLGNQAVGYNREDMEEYANVHYWMELAIHWLDRTLSG